jgi:hypothetical protein
MPKIDQVCRQTRLVRWHLERVSGRVLEEHGDLLRGFVHRGRGIYALYRKDRLYYVGLASNLPSRLAHHLRDRHAGKWDRFSLYVTSRDSHIRELESLVLRITEPRGNQLKNKLVGSTDIRPRLKTAIKERSERELTDFFGDRGGRREPQPRKVAKPQGAANPLAGIVKWGVMHLRFWHRGNVHKALLRRDGRIRFGGEIYSSPSLAAIRAGGMKRVNGWKTWKYKNEAGEWRYIDELRRKA